jgi:hypothetical protein
MLRKLLRWKRLISIQLRSDSLELHRLKLKLILSEQK